MLKFPLFLLMTLFCSLSSEAKSYVRSHDDFVHMSNYEKNQVILKTMELVVELESKYLYEVKTSGYNQKRFEQFQAALSKIRSLLFLNSAYAAPSKLPMNDWKDYGNNFTKLMHGKKGDCIFAGWVSKSYTLKGKTYCAHPDFQMGLQSNRHSNGMAAVTSAYPDPKPDSGCGLNDRTKIQCNPAIFGFKKRSDQSLFCVKASDGAHNSSYHCMQEALKEGSDDKTDSPADRLGFLRDQLAAGPEIFKGVQEFVYKTCVCEQTSEGFNKNYHQYMRPHRTCYGLMEMLSATVVCEDPKLPINTSIFESLKAHASANIPADAVEAKIDYEYKIFVDEKVKKSATAEYNQLCGASLAIPADIPAAPEKKYVCSKAVCAANAEAEDSESVACTFSVTEEGNEAEISFEKDPKYVAPDGGSDSISIEGVIAGKEVSLDCPIEKLEKPKEEVLPTLVVSISSKSTTSYDVKATSENDEGWTFAWSIQDKGKLKVKEGWAKVTSKTKKATALPGQVVEETKEKEEKPKEVVKSDGRETTQLRHPEDYKVCGQLTKGDKKIPESPSCVTIDKIKIAAQNQTGPQNTPPPQMPGRMGSDTSAIGIK